MIQFYYLVDKFKTKMKSKIWCTINHMKLTFLVNLFKIKLKVKLRKYRPTLKERINLNIKHALSFNF
jgi:hypothetical protein